MGDSWGSPGSFLFVRFVIRFLCLFCYSVSFYDVLAAAAGGAKAVGWRRTLHDMPYGCVCVRRVPGAGGALGRGCGLPMRRAPAGIGSRISCTMGLFVFAGAHAEEKGTSEH